MAALIDTHALVWLGIDDPQLSRPARDVLLDPDQALFVSAVTAYEFVDLNRRGRFEADLDLEDILDRLGAVILDFPSGCSIVAGLLPSIHLDPVDRMLIAHAIQTDVPIVTADSDIHKYPVRTIW